MSKFQNLKFKSNSQSEVNEVISLLGKLGYEVHCYFIVEDALKHGGLCAWDNGEITEGYLSSNDFKEVTLEDLKGMVCKSENENMVLWLNKETLEEQWLHEFYYFNDTSLWVQVPDGATFATGYKDNFVFRKDGWYFDDGEWVATYLTLDKVQNIFEHALLWVKSDIKDNGFTLERLLGCEVNINYSGVTGYVTDIDNNGYFLHICCGRSFDVVSKNNLTFFTEDGDEVTFDEYVAMYYGDNCI